MEALVFVNLGPTNEGLPTSARKEGPAFQAMKRLAIDQKLSVVFKLAGIDGWLRSAAKVVWLSHSGTAGGLQLVEMPAESRRVVDMWFAAREQAGQTVEASSSQTAPARAVAPPASADFGLDSYQVVLPVEAIEIAPGPAQRSQPLAHVVVRANTRAAAPVGAANLGSSAAAPQFRGLTGASEKAPASAPRKSLKVERKTAKSFALVLGTLLVIFFVGGVIIAEFHGLPARSASAVVPSDVPPAPATAPLPPVDTSTEPYAPPPSAAPQSALTAPETASPEPLASVKAAKPAPPVTPRVLARAASQPEASSPARPRQALRAAPPSSPRSSGMETRAALTVPVAPPPAATATSAAAAPATPVSERPPVAPAPVVVAANAPLPAAVPPPNRETPAGSVEIISDPYPSIRAPAAPGGRGSRPAALSIGPLTSKVQPVYPPEALRQRVAGTVKIHIVRGVDGRVETATVTDGPIPLRNAALQAVQQWRYQPTLLGTTPVEAEEDVALIFRITVPSQPGN